MKPKMRALFVIRDIASVHALAPLIQHMQDTYEVSIIAEDVAQSALPQMYQLLPDDLPQGDLGRYFHQRPPHIVIAGTSVQPSLEKDAIRLAHQHAIPSLAVIDSWTNYAPRFDDPLSGEKLAYLPSLIATFDEISRAELMALGIPAERVMVTGNPHFARYAMDFQPIKSREVVRAEWHIPSDANVLMFVSEPLADAWYTQLASGYPLEEEIRACLRACITALEALPKGYLLVKLHPIEAPDLVMSEVASLARPNQVIGRYDPLSLANAADLVVGMNSNLLLETALVGYPTLSIRQISPEVSPSISQRFTIIEAAYGDDAIQSSLRTRLAALDLPHYHYHSSTAYRLPLDEVLRRLRGLIEQLVLNAQATTS